MGWDPHLLTVPLMHGLISHKYWPLAINVRQTSGLHDEINVHVYEYKGMSMDPIGQLRIV